MTDGFDGVPLLSLAGVVDDSSEQRLAGGLERSKHVRFLLLPCCPTSRADAVQTDRSSYMGANQDLFLLDLEAKISTISRECAAPAQSPGKPTTSGCDAIVLGLAPQEPDAFGQYLASFRHLPTVDQSVKAA